MIFRILNKTEEKLLTFAVDLGRFDKVVHIFVNFYNQFTEEHGVIEMEAVSNV